MASIHSIDNNLSNIIKDLKPHEMKQYIKFNVNKLYDAFLNHEEKEALASKKAIEEATKLYISEGYENSLSVELGLRLDKANELLIETLTEKENLRELVFEIGIHKIYEKLIFNITLLEILEVISEDLTNTGVIVDCVELIKNSSIDIEIFMDANEMNNSYESKDSMFYHSELYSTMVKKYNKFQILLNKFEGLNSDT